MPDDRAARTSTSHAVMAASSCTATSRAPASGDPASWTDNASSCTATNHAPASGDPASWTDALFLSKPFSDVRRQRHDESWARYGLHGHTGRRKCACTSCQARFGVELTRNHNEQLGSGLSCFKGLENANRLLVPFACTAFEMQGGRAFCPAATTLHKGNAWAEVPRLLRDASVALPEVIMRKDGMRVTCFHLEATHEELPNPEVAKLEESLRTKIYQVARGGRGRRAARPKLWATLSKQAPVGVYDPLLPFARLHCASKSVPISAVVRDRCASWDVGLADGRLLEVDLGRTCVISAFSTQGRHPATRVYPRVVHRRTSSIGDGELLPSGFSVEDQPDHPPCEPYAGPAYTILVSADDPEYDRVRHRGVPPWPLAWVSRYELLWRADGGRAWHSLGEFRGNSDPTTEVAHLFADVQGHLKARYLRVRPLDWHNDGAMRLGVYGVADADARDCSVTGRATQAKAKAGKAEEPQHITYQLAEPTPTLNRRFSCQNPQYQGGRSSRSIGDRKGGERCLDRQARARGALAEQLEGEADAAEQAELEAGSSSRAAFQGRPREELLPALLEAALLRLQSVRTRASAASSFDLTDGEGEGWYTVGADDLVY